MRTKIERFMKPETPADYGLSLTEEEAMTVPELAPWILAARDARATNEDMAKMGANAARMRLTFISALVALTACTSAEVWQLEKPEMAPHHGADPLAWAVRECNGKAADMLTINQCMRDYGYERKDGDRDRKWY